MTEQSPSYASFDWKEADRAAEGIQRMADAQGLSINAAALLVSVDATAVDGGTLEFLELADAQLRPQGSSVALDDTGGDFYVARLVDPEHLRDGECFPCDIVDRSATPSEQVDGMTKVNPSDAAETIRSMLQAGNAVFVHGSREDQLRVAKELGATPASSEA